MKQNLISNQLIDTIRAQSDLLAIASEYVSLKKRGQNYTGLCPFHQEKTASFTLNPVKQFFHCFGCGTGGDVFHFIEKIEGISFPEVLRTLAERGGIPLSTGQSPQAAASQSETEEIFRLNKVAASYFQHNLLERPEGASALAYLKARGVSSETIRTFSIGYALPSWNHLFKTYEKRFGPLGLEKSGLTARKDRPTNKAQGTPDYYDRFRNRVIFPIFTAQGKVAGFGGRVLDDGHPKYLNTSETAVFSKGKILFGLHKTKNTGGHPLVIVEGYLDAITAYQAGIPNVVATLGTALTASHLRLLRRLSEKVLLIFDGDDAGVRSALRTAPLLIDHEISAHIVSLPAGVDPDTFIRERGKEAFLKKMENSETIIDFYISHTLKGSALKSVSDKMKVIAQVVPLINRLRSSVEKSHYLKVLSDTLFLREADVRAEYSRLTKRSKTSAAHPGISLKIQNEVSPPDEQEKILMHLIQGYLDPVTMNGKLNLADFTHPIINKIISAYWNPQDKRWFVPDHTITADDKACRSLLSRLSVLEIDSDQGKQEKDYIRMLCRKRLDRERSEAELQLKQTQLEGDPEIRHHLQKRILDLKKEASLLTLSH